MYEHFGKVTDIVFLYTIGREEDFINSIPMWHFYNHNALPSINTFEPTFCIYSKNKLISYGLFFLEFHGFPTSIRILYAHIIFLCKGVPIT